MTRTDDRAGDLLRRAIEATLELPTPAGPSSQLMTQTLAVLEHASSLPHVTLPQRIKHMFWQYKTPALLTAASLLIVYVGVSSFTGTALAFDDIAKALNSVRSATYDFASEFENPVDGKKTIFKAKGYFLAPSLERVESSTTFGGDKEVRSIMVLDSLAAKGINLLPEQKKAIIINISTTEPSIGGTASMFESVRQLVQEDGSESDEKVEPLGEKEIDGSLAAGYRKRTNMANITLWADQETAQLIRVDFEYTAGGGRAQMSNFRYDVELNPSLFSLEPPAGYDVQTQSVKKPAEEDLVNVLRLVAEHNKGIFPDAIGMNEKSFMLASQAAAKSESEKLLKTPEVQERMEKLKAQYGEDQGAFMKAWMKEWMELAAPITQENLAGVLFYTMLQPENDSHYAGKGVKFGTLNRPIFWYKPTGADSYRVIYADLSIKEVSQAELPHLSVVE